MNQVKMFVVSLVALAGVISFFYNPLVGEGIEVLRNAAVAIIAWSIGTETPSVLGRIKLKLNGRK